MNPKDILLLGLKQHISAVHRKDGRLLWETKLKGGAATGFITLVCDGPRIFATCNGVLHALDFLTGALLWTNPLKGYGYGIASLCLPEIPANLQSAAAAQLAADAAAAAAASGSSAAHG